MKGFDVIHAKSAVKARNKMDLSAPVLATMDIGQIVPLGTWELIPGDDFKVQMNAFSRLAPLVEPTYGKVHFKTVKAFVPYHQIAWDSDAWLAGKTTWEGVTPIGRFLTLESLSVFYRSYCLDVNATATASDCDISWKDTSGNVQYGVFSNVGRYYNKVLNSLGYCFPQNTNLKTGSAWKDRLAAIKLSAYPLLAFAKLYNDYMSQSQRFNTSALSSFLQNVKYCKTQTGFSVSTGVIDSTGISIILQNIKLNYENDYFTSAWQSPNNALGVGESISSAGVPSGIGSPTVGHFNNDTALTQSNGASGGGSTFTLGQRSLDLLRRFDDWVRRNNYSGSRSVQQLYSRFGIKTEDYKSHYAHILDTDDIPIQIGDVTATAASYSPSASSDPTIPLGDYAGKGIMSGQVGCSYKSSDFGMLFILGYYTVTPLNAYGFDRSVLRNDPFDYYNPEFDGLGADAISLFEVFENPRGAADSDAVVSDAVFGFTERYNSYRYGRPKILGDFRKYQNSDPMNSWHTGRLLGDIRKAGYLVAQSSSMNTLPQVGSEYNRIFSITSADVDHFYLTCYFDVSAVRPMLNLNQVPNLGEGDTSVPRNGNVIS